MPKTCIFCRQPVRDPTTNRKRAREHVFAKWALEEFNLTDHRVEFSQLEATDPKKSSLQLTEQTPIREVDLDNFLLGNVCSRCNHGWMSKLEDATKPELRRLVPGHAKSISEAAKPVFAKWALKTTIVIGAYLGPPIARIPRSHGQSMVGERLHLPKGVSVFHRQSATWRVHFAVTQTWIMESESKNEILRKQV